MAGARTTVSLVYDELTAKHYLEGKEEVVGQTANVFGNGDFIPLADSYNNAISIEAEVVHSFSDRADDDASDYSDVYMFRLWLWQARPEGALARVYMPWQDFNGDEPPGAEYGWDRLLHEAVFRLRKVRFDRQPFAPVMVGAPPKEAALQQV